MKKLKDYSAAEQAEMPYSALAALRVAAYAEHVAAMTVPDELKNFSAAMTERFGATIQVWRVRMPWLAALLVVRYGEEPAHWPSKFTDSDIERALQWMAGETPPPVVWANRNPNLR